MKDIDKKEILKLISQYSNLKESTSAAKLRNYLKTNGVNSISLPTIAKYKTLLLTKKNLYDQKIGIETDSYDEIINEIVNELSRNRKREAERAHYRKEIHKELIIHKDKYKLELLKSQNCVYQKNKILKQIKKDICSKLQHIPKNTLNYLYNDEAKKLDLLSKKATMSNELAIEIENLFKNGTIQKYVINNYNGTISPIELVQVYIEKTCNIRLSTSIIRRYFNNYYKSINLSLMYKMFMD